jgi:putative DNA methylase
MQQPKKLIEVAMPVKEISAESVRDKSIRHGHISTLHLWWARRPLPVCRAVVFASLVPDPLDEYCPQAFKDAVKDLLGKPFALDKGGSEVDWYKPYTDIPYTAAHDLMEDNLRNRVLMFIGKYSIKFVENERSGKPTNPKDQLNEASLIKWETRNSDTVITIARKLIWVAFNSQLHKHKSVKDLLTDFDYSYTSISEAEQQLYATSDRHKESDDVKRKEANLHKAIEAFLNKMPKVFDPFAGGGAIPLEAARLGCRSFGNDINPVAHIIQKGSLEFPQRFGKPITYSKTEFEKVYGKETFANLPGEWKKVEAGATNAVRIPNRLSFDVEFYAKKLIHEAGKSVGDLYPKDEFGNSLFVNIWARVGQCANPTCKAEVPLLKQFYLFNPRSSDDANKRIYLHPIIEKNKIEMEIRNGDPQIDGWVSRGNLLCPCCGSVTSNRELKQQFITGTIREILLVKVFETTEGYKYVTVNEYDQREYEVELPTEKMQPNSAGGDTFSWGYTKWGQLFSKRQLLSINSFIKALNYIREELGSSSDYEKAVLVYLAILINRIAVRGTSFGKWHYLQATVEHLFGRQAIQMNFDYPEINPFGTTTGSAFGQLFYIQKYIESESENSFWCVLNNAASGDREQFNVKSITASVTDPPYYDAIAYADISDFFYVWLKRTLTDVYPLNFSTPQTPKSEECTALKHHHENDYEKAKKHFEDTLLSIFKAIEHQTTDIVSIMFAHQSTEAWTTLCNSILGANMNITGSWANDTEMTGALKTDKAFLSSSVTVSCRPIKREGFAHFRDVKKAIELRVEKEVDQLYKLGFRGSDLLTACFGQAVSEFGKYEKVEKADGSEVRVSELLEMARESAFNALVKGFDADEFTKFFIAWAQLYGFSENEFDDVNRLVKIGLSIETNALFQEKLLIKNGNKQSLAGYTQRIYERPSLGTEMTDSIIDQVHRGMYYFKKNDRNALLQHISQVANSPDSLFWRVVNSLVEVLPLDKDHDDKKIATELLASKDNLIRDSKQQQPTTQTTLGL